MTKDCLKEFSAKMTDMEKLLTSRTKKQSYSIAILI